MFTHILVPVDGSAGMRDVLDKASSLAKTYQSAVTAVYVLDPQPYVGVSSEFAYGQSDAVHEARAAGEQALQQASVLLAASGQSVSAMVVEEGTPWRGILRHGCGAGMILTLSHVGG